MSPLRFEVRSLGKSYGTTRALCDVSFAVTAGEHLAVLGPSGSGKSTVLRLLAGLEAPDAGVVLLEDVAVSKPGRILLAPHRRGIALVFQDLALWPNLSAQANVMMGLSGLALSRLEALARTHEALSLCGINELADRKPHAMSGGQQQRVALARAVAARPAFLLMDEPYAGLDLVLKSRLLPEVRALAASRNMTVILVTHDPLEAISLCRSAVVLDQGRVVEAGPLAQLLRAPRSELLRIFRHEFGRHESGKKAFQAELCEAGSALRPGTPPPKEIRAHRFADGTGPGCVTYSTSLWFSHVDNTTGNVIRGWTVEVGPAFDGLLIPS